MRSLPSSPRRGLHNDEFMCLAIPGQILSIAGGNARVSFGGLIKEVCLAFVPEAQAGDYVIVHVGFAISVLDESVALRTLEHLQDSQ